MHRIFLCFLIAVSIGCSSDRSPTKSVKKVEQLPVPLDIPEDYVEVTPSLFSKPLASVQTDENGFSLVSDSGVDFANEFDRDKPYRFIETGAGLALADYDNDGWVDIYLVATDGPNKLFRGLGDFKFEDKTEFAGVDGSIAGKDVWGAGATFADVDNDGDLDLFVANMSATNILYLNNGDGTFKDVTSRAGLSRRGANKIGSFCDYDRDGDLDLYLLTYQDDMADRPCEFTTTDDGGTAIHPDFREWYGFVGTKVMEAGEADLLYENNGDGTFVDVTEKAGLLRYSMGLSVSWFDYDQDGWQDVYVANDFWQPDHLFKNNGDGTFTDVLQKLARHTPWYSMGSDTGDLNNDGLIDLMVADMSASTHYKQKVNMGDMNDTGWFLEFPYPRQYMRNCLFINTGTNRFMESAFQSGLESTDWTWAVRFADLDCDGLQDVFVTNGHARDSMNADLIRQKEAQKSAGRLDAVFEANKATPPVKEKNAAFKNLGDFQFDKVGERWGLDHEGVSHGAAFADFDLDGDLDLVVNNLYEQAHVYRNDFGSGNRLLIQFQSQNNNRFGYGTTVEIWHGSTHQTRTLTPTRGYISSDAPMLQFGLADDVAIDRMKVTWPDGNMQVYEELKANQLYLVLDSKEEYVETETETETETVGQKRESSEEPLFTSNASELGLKYTHFEFDYDDFKKEPLLPYRLSRLGPGVAVGDINDDGFDDVFVSGASSHTGELFVNRDGKSYEKIPGPWNNAYQSEQMGAVFFDADSDGDQDLYVVSGGNEFKPESGVYQDQLYLNLGDEKFEKATEEVLPELRDSGSCVAAADFDRDGDLDLFVGSRSVPRSYPKTPTSRLLRNNEGKFEDVTVEIGEEALSQSGLINSAVWSDFNNDGWVDLLLAVEWGPIKVFENQEGKLVEATKDLGLSNYKGWWRGIVGADLDGDGDMDYVATNQGLNTKYHADFDHPHRIYFDDFDNNGTLDIVESEFEGDTEFPVRGRSCSSNCMPFIAEKFDTFNDFALASITDIYGEDLDSKSFVEVNYLPTSIIWNEGEEGMRVESLPTLAQISPGFGIEVKDFDADGILDILLANNFYSSQKETGIMDGGLGLFLKGKESGKQFEPMWPKESGVSLPFDSKALATGDLDQDGDLDVLVSQNRGELVLLTNQSNPSGYLQIELEGAKGNTHAIGATVNVLTSDGKSQMFEVTAGGSYLSQSASGIVVPATSIEELKEVQVRWPDGTNTTWTPTDDAGPHIQIAY